MPSTIYTIKGKAMWPKLFEKNRDMEGFEGSARAWGGTYSVNLEVDEDEADNFERSGTASKIKFDRKTKTSTITLKRKHVGPFEEAGGPPKVYNKDGSVRTYEDGVIWNGSTVECEYEVYTTSKANGTRLRSVTILELAEAPEKEEDENPVEKPVEKAKTKYNTDVPF